MVCHEYCTIFYIIIISFYTLLYGSLFVTTFEGTDGFPFTNGETFLTIGFVIKGIFGFKLFSDKIFP